MLCHFHTSTKVSLIISYECVCSVCTANQVLSKSPRSLEGHRRKICPPLLFPTVCSCHLEVEAKGEEPFLSRKIATVTE